MTADAHSQAMSDDHYQRYGPKHRKLRAKYKREVEAGTAFCWRCLKEGKPEEQAWIAPGTDWDLGHVNGSDSEERAPEHSFCNRRTMAHRPPRRRPTERHPGMIA